MKVPNGKISYFEIPSGDIDQSSSFYKNVFGWKIRTRPDGTVAFDDVEGGASGSWIINAEPHVEKGFKMYIMVDSLAETMRSILDNGGRIVEPISGNSPEITAMFSDPYGNIFGIGQE
ncbi:MAG TPA: VOC family protein [Bacteroidales bacterium]|jgi:predicted enzyme related to lactoylglutathione lyase|nr:VOC family protein [Bacteroidales bacterium]